MKENVSRGGVTDLTTRLEMEPDRMVCRSETEDLREAVRTSKEMLWPTSDGR